MEVTIWRLLLAGLAMALTTPAGAAGVSDGPLQKAIQLLADLQSKLINEALMKSQNFEEFSRFCEMTSMQKQATIKDENEQINTLKATAETARAENEELDALVQKLSGEVSVNEKEAKKATAIRNKEHADFLKRDADLGSTVDMLARAHRVLEENLNKGAAPSEMETQLAQVTSTLRTMVDASFVELDDKAVIEALLQQSEDEADGSDELQPQADADAYKEKSAGILDTIATMQEKAQVARNEMQKQEMSAQHNFEMLEQAVQSELATLRKQLDDTKKNKSKNEETKATAEGSLELVTKDLQSDTAYLADLQKECMTKADEFELEQKESAAEIKVLKMARTILMKAGKGALVQESSDSAPALSFLQMKAKAQTATAATATSQMLWERQSQAADWLTSFADQYHNPILAQIGDRMHADPFEKVKEMITAMVEKLLQEQAEEAEHKAWCDQELGKTTKALTSNKDKLETIQTRIAGAQSQSAELAEQIGVLTKELGDMDMAMQEATAMRQKEHNEFLVTKKQLGDFQQATAGAIQVLRDYYSGGSFLQEQATTDASMSTLMSQASSDSQPAGSVSSSILGMLEVAESDFSKGLAEAIAAEDVAAQEYNQMTNDNKVSKAQKSTDMKNKQAEKERLDGLVSETQLDEKESQEEANAVQEYMDKLKGSCETKMPSHEERQLRRKQEMEGLQNALAIIEGKAVGLLQESVSPLSLLRR